MQARRLKHTALIRIHRQEPADGLVVVPGPQVVESDVRIILLARVQIIILRGTGAVEEITESVIGVCVRHGLGAVRELPCGKLAVVMIIRCQRT